MGRAFAVRGIVEGFYGTPWTHNARLRAISFLAPRGLNAYVYAPKDDAKHRTDWRTGYDSEELAHFGELAAVAGTNGARVGFAISPGLDISYGSDTDRAALFAKLEPLLDVGIPWFLLLLDDIPLQRDLAPRQAELATWLFARLRATRADTSLTLCPTEYVGTRPSPYLGELGAGLPADIDVMWTGPTVCSPTVRADDAQGWTEALGGHRTIVWDNTPVNDATMTNELHLGPYLGRDADLADVVGGVLCNPMTQAYASLLQLSTAMEFLSDPDAYDAPRAWARAWADLGGERAEPLAVLARASADGPLVEPGTLELTQLVDRLEVALDGPDWADAAAALARELRAAPRWRQPSPTTISAPKSRRGPARPPCTPRRDWPRSVPSSRCGRSSGKLAARSFRRIPSRPCNTLLQSPIHGWPRVPMNTPCSDHVRRLYGSRPAPRRGRACPRHVGVPARERQRRRPAVPAGAQHLRGLAPCAGNGASARDRPAALPRSSS